MAIKTENLAIIMTDIVDFTKITVHQSRSENEQLLATHNDILYPILRHYSGRHVKSIGDALLIVFKSPTDAMLCAMAMQDALFEHNQKDDSQSIHIRIGASLGEVRVTRNDIFGEPVNLTSRVEGVTPPDEIYLTEALYMSMNKAEVPAEEVGFKEIRGLKEPIRLYSIPRFSESRLVPQDVSTKDLEGISFPYGGAHLSFSEELKNSKFKVPASLANIRTPSSKFLWLVPAFIAAAILFWLGTNFRSEQQETDNPSSTAQTKSAQATDSPISSNSTTSAGPSGAEVTGGQIETEGTLQSLKPDDSIEKNKETTEQTFVSNASSTDSPGKKQTGELKKTVVLTDSDKKGTPKPTSAKPVVKEVQKEKPKFKWNVRIAKSEYRARRIDKAQYRKIIYDLKIALRKNINKEKEIYRARKISKAEYKKRVRKLEADYRG